MKTFLPTSSTCNSLNGFKQDLLDKLIDLGLLEDLGAPALDLTTEPLVDSKLKAEAIIYCHTPNTVIAGIPIIEQVFTRLAKEIQVKPLAAEGELIEAKSAAIAKISGPAGAILIGERLALNLLQRMCAVASTTRLFVEKANKFQIDILDTRKTTPGLRVIEKYAVLTAGGKNHRFGLNDAILVKDNHIQIAGSITKAVQLLRSKYPDKMLEVECTNLNEVEETLNLNVNCILLDNMSPDSVQKAVKLINGRCFVEVSGGINLENINNYLLTGVNAISIGALTHSAQSVDLSLEVETKP